jgi:hypothetical protein
MIALPRGAAITARPCATSASTVSAVMSVFT